jgi:hypothetical protein
VKTVFPDAQIFGKTIEMVLRRCLRVVKWLGTVPAIGECTSCNVEFKVPLNCLRRVADAQEHLRLSFSEHECDDELEAA